MSASSILVVEDEPVIALDIRQRLQQLGYKVVAIADCAEVALDATARFQPNLVLMDIHLRGTVNGIETAAHIRERFNLPVVFLTAHADHDTLEHAKATHPFGYIVKPFDTHDLSTTIEIALIRYKTELTIQTMLNHEKELNELKSRFVALVSHEFRNPLGTILFCLDLLEYQRERLTPEKQQTCLRRARTSALRMSELLEEVLVLGETEAGSLNYDPQAIDLTKFCHELVEEFRLTIGSSHIIEFTITHLAGYVCHCRFDERLLQHILSNLLSNAVKYSPEGSVVWFDLLQQPDKIVFRVSDQGIGIPTADQEKLFNCFHRGSNVGKIPGTGLGLSIAKQCIEAHQGTISVESIVDKGTTFTVTLPCNESSVNGLNP